MTIAEKLAEYTRMLNQHGREHPKVREFIERHKDDQEFVELAGLAADLKDAFAHQN